MPPTLKNAYQTCKMYESLRTQLMDVLADEDLAFTPGGENLSLGGLCVEIGEIQHAYAESFRTFTQNFDYRAEQTGLAGSVAALKTWYAKLDEEFEQALDALSPEDVESREIDRGGDFKLLTSHQIDIYKEALLIFYGKASVYLKAIGKPRPSSWVDWIA